MKRLQGPQKKGQSLILLGKAKNVNPIWYLLVPILVIKVWGPFLQLDWQIKTFLYVKAEKGLETGFQRKKILLHQKGYLDLQMKCHLFA